MTPIIYTGAPNIEHGGNLPRNVFLGGAALRIWSVRGTEDVPIHGAALIVENAATGALNVLHTADPDVEAWLAAGWRITSY